MKNLSTLLSSIALLAVGVLYYLHITHTEKLKKQIAVQNNKKDSTYFRIAYFDIDSLQTHFEFFQQAEDQVREKENAARQKLNDLESRYQNKVREWQAKGENISQSEQEAIQLENMRLQETYKQTKYNLDQEMQKFQIDLMADLRKKIEEFLATYNKEKGYAYIFAYQPGFMMYYRDTLYDITPDLIKGLNAEYSNKKKK